ncbi:inositol monophosphatase family protein [Demequina sp. SYSU T00039]|uniref:Inositol-1-monophosphatase n=1 Tax=Demequina lignilytica TaxID=3051663 RepID=A0AAW7LZP1_9MICO|nr:MULTISPECIES: inositol monophosphatase family protein [unclassified Demequina]MDN4486784.1 inositol monophosphatase family protein [Demequina sp. SYSU T00039]MDN4489468.1 inositol monophosphatase family protein [Demequina sp. SYSU T00068]
MTTPLELMDVARTLALEAQRLVAAGRREAEVQHTKSSDVDIVTQMDIAAERLLRQRLAELRPDDGVLGEEGDDVASRSGITWVVDPIDGTVNYLYGIPHWSVSVAAVSGPPEPRAWTLEAGAVADAGGSVWSAARGEGAWRDGRRLRREGTPALGASLVATGFQYTADKRAAQGRLVAQLLPQIRDIRRLGSASIDLCHVAAGLVDAYYEHGLHPWDFAAGALIAAEAGLRVAGLDGAAPDDSLLVAAAPGAWDALHDALIAAGARTI